MSDVRGVICQRNFHEVETDGGLSESPVGKRQVNVLEGGSSEGFVENVQTGGGCAYLREWRGGWKQKGKLSYRSAGGEIVRRLT